MEAPKTDRAVLTEIIEANTVALAAREALAEAERNVTDADEKCAAAEAEFRLRPLVKGAHGAAASATQFAANCHAALESARAAVVAAERQVVEAELQAAIGRARREQLLSRIEPAMTRLREIHSETVKLVAEITAACDEQDAARKKALALAASIGVAASVSPAVAPSFIRAMVGVRIARDVYLSGQRWVRGLEPCTFIEPRPALPSGHHSEGEWRAARKLALPADEFLPAGARYDLGNKPREFFHAERAGEVIDVH